MKRWGLRTREFEGRAGMLVAIKPESSNVKEKGKGRSATLTTDKKVRNLASMLFTFDWIIFQW
jgi:hypothetical protein